MCCCLVHAFDMHHGTPLQGDADLVALVPQYATHMFVTAALCPHARKHDQTRTVLGSQPLCQLVIWCERRCARPTIIDHGQRYGSSHSNKHPTPLCLIRIDVMMLVLLHPCLPHVLTLDSRLELL